MGQKKLYIIDLARAKSKDDKEQDLLANLEEGKSGLTVGSLYGKNHVLIQEPPHIIVSSNYYLNYDLLSEDRWEVYRLTKRNKLKKKNIKNKKRSKELQEKTKKH